METRKTKAARGQRAAGASTTGHNDLRPDYTPTDPETQDITPQTYWHAARWLAGGGDADHAPAAAVLPDFPGDRSGYNAWVDAHPQHAQRIAAIDPEGDPPGGPPLQDQLLTADQLLTTDWPEPVWAIPDLLPSGLTLLAGKPKIGKSWLALQVAQAVATGGRTLGRTVKRGPTLYLALEDPARRLSARMKKQHWPLGTDAEFMILGNFADRVGDLRNGGGETLAGQIEKRGYRYVVIDTLSRAVQGDQSDVTEMTMALSPMQESAHANNCAIVMLDHHRKNFGANPDAIADILGSTAKGAMSDCVWGLYRDRGTVGAKLQIIGRDLVEQTLAVNFDAVTGCWQCDGSAHELELTKRRQEILDGLGAIGKSSNRAIAEFVEQPRGNTHNRLQDLVGAGLVLRIEEGNRVFYTLP